VGHRSWELSVLKLPQIAAFLLEYLHALRPQAFRQTRKFRFITMPHRILCPEYIRVEVLRPRGTE
jgi:hypothetical protein